jgi:hypothetical protein
MIMITSPAPSRFVKGFVRSRPALDADAAEQACRGPHEGRVEDLLLPEEACNASALGDRESHGDAVEVGAMVGHDYRRALGGYVLEVRELEARVGDELLAREWTHPLLELPAGDARHARWGVQRAHGPALQPRDAREAGIGIAHDRAPHLGQQRRIREGAGVEVAAAQRCAVG